MLGAYSLSATVAFFTLLRPTLAAQGRPVPSVWGKACSVENQRYDQNTYGLVTDCDAQTYCATNGTCAFKGCRRDIFPFGYNFHPFETLPPLCSPGYFCPDEGDQCLPDIPIGGQCQKDRDDECLPPSNYRDLAGPLNTNGTICLNYQCYLANATVGQTCVTDNTRYTAYTDSGNEYAIIISRDNCANGLYCDGTALQCFRTKPVGAACTGNKECASYNCPRTGFCGVAASDPIKPAIWVYVIVGISIVGLLIGTVVGLWFVHRKSREENQRKLEQYWNEQMAYRQSILSMHQAKADLSEQGQQPDKAYSTSVNYASSNAATGAPHVRPNSVQFGDTLLPPDMTRRESEAQWSEEGSEVLLVPSESRRDFKQVMARWR